jgi:Sensors of blue-light using FAD
MTTENLYRLVYFSRNTIPGKPVQIAAQIESILESARRNNAPRGVTGALIFNSGVFAQVLEGAREDIEHIFERIQCDARHSEVQVLALEETASRRFPSWSMAFIGRSVEGQNLFSRIAEATGFEAKRMEGERVLEIISSIAIEEEAIGA